MKTPLPKKVTGPDTIGLGYWASEVTAMTLEELQKSHNQLIDYLAELTKVVEGKPSYTDGYKQGKFDAQMDAENTPTLKEQLLGEIKKLKRHSVVITSVSDTLIEKSYTVTLSDVEAIINRILN